LAAATPVSTHTISPVEQEVTPTWHWATGVQTRPAVHAAHVPLSQTSLVPHAVPLAAVVPVSTHTGVPVVHEVAPE
jgi:hypothetical protein